MGRRDPLRAVLEAELKSSRGLMRGSAGYTWTLTLACGHVVERRVSYQEGQRPSRASALPHQQRARCPACGRETRNTLRGRR